MAMSSADLEKWKAYFRLLIELKRKQEQRKANEL
jgi:hypothetical protein